MPSYPPHTHRDTQLETHTHTEMKDASRNHSPLRNVHSVWTPQLLLALLLFLEEEPKLQATARLYQLLEVLQNEGTAGMSLAIELGAEFEELLEEARMMLV